MSFVEACLFAPYMVFVMLVLVIEPKKLIFFLYILHFPCFVIPHQFQTFHVLKEDENLIMNILFNIE